MINCLGLLQFVLPQISPRALRRRAAIRHIKPPKSRDSSCLHPPQHFCLLFGRAFPVSSDVCHPFLGLYRFICTSAPGVEFALGAPRCRLLAQSFFSFPEEHLYALAENFLWPRDFRLGGRPSFSCISPVHLVEYTPSAATEFRSRHRHSRALQRKHPSAGEFHWSLGHISSVGDRSRPAAPHEARILQYFCA